MSAEDMAAKAAAERDQSAVISLPPQEQWDILRRDQIAEDAKYAEGPHRFSMGRMPLQMFGQGFEIQSAVSDNADKILLLQLGGSGSGIPIDFQGDGIVQIWIAPEDLAKARFDRTTTTFDMT